MKLRKNIRKDLNDIFDFDCELTQKFKTVEAAEKASRKRTNSNDCWGNSNLMIPSKDIKKWFKLAAENLSHNRRTVIVSPYNPHYLYWFEYVHPYASSVILFKQKFPMFTEYEKPSPKTICLVVFDPKQRKNPRPRKQLYSDYANGKFVYFKIPLHLDKKYKKD